MVNRKRISLSDKIKILDECNKGVSLQEISIKYKIPKSSICTLKKMKAKIITNFEATNNGSKNRRSLKNGEYPRMEEELYGWFLNQRKKHIPVNGNVLKAKAIDIQKKLNDGSFHASDGWLSRFKNRYGIRLLKESGEKLSSRAELVEPFKTELKKIIREHNLTLDAIFNADETGLYWKMLPDKTFVHAGEASAPGRKTSKERLSILLCANASGTKQGKPLVIGKAKKPRSFRNKILPVNYLHSNKGWMNAGIFKIWFFEMFAPEVESFLELNKLPIKALLILDNAPCHPPAEQLVKTTKDGQIWTLYMPPNVTPLIQPMDQNAIRLLKLQYRNSLLSKIVSSGSDDIVIFLKNLDLYEATSMISLAWKNLNRHMLAKCWNKILLPCNDDFDEEDDVPLMQLLHRDEIVCMRRSFRLLSSVFPNITFNMDDINDWNREESYQYEIEDNEENDEPAQANPDLSTGFSETNVKHADAIKCFETCILWSQQNNIDYSKSLVLREIQEEAVQKSLEISTKQTSINDYFQLR